MKQNLFFSMQRKHSRKHEGKLFSLEPASTCQAKCQNDNLCDPSGKAMNLHVHVWLVFAIFIHRFGILIGTALGITRT